MHSRSYLHSMAALLLVALVLSCSPRPGTGEAGSGGAEKTVSAVPYEAAGNSGADAGSEVSDRAPDLDARAFARRLSPASGSGPVLLDVRTPGEFADGYIQGAINMDINAPDFADRLGKLDRNAEYLLYCRSGNRSGVALGMMRDLGFSSVSHLEGGIGAWMRNGGKVLR